jgi:hypothetical protein
VGVGEGLDQEILDQENIDRNQVNVFRGQFMIVSYIIGGYGRIIYILLTKQVWEVLYLTDVLFWCNWKKTTKFDFSY